MPIYECFDRGIQIDNYPVNSYNKKWDSDNNNKLSCEEIQLPIISNYIDVELPEKVDLYVDEFKPGIEMECPQETKLDNSPCHLSNGENRIVQLRKMIKTKPMS